MISCRTAILTVAVISATIMNSWCEERVFTPEQLKLPGKRGASLWDHSPEARRNGYPWVAKINPYWTYSWGHQIYPERNDVVGKNKEFAPMIWSAKSAGAKSVEDLTQIINEKLLPLAKKGEVKRLLGFNEPDGKGQADMTVEEALKYWPALEALKVPLCSPSAIHADGDWHKKFLARILEKNYRVDYIGVHWYGGANPLAFKNHLKKVHELYGGKTPLLITEFSPADWGTKGDYTKNKHTPEKVLAFAKDVIPWMEKQDWIAGYTWYSFRIYESQGYTSALHDEDGNLTALGKYYASVTTEKPEGDQSIQPDDAEAQLTKAQAAAKKLAENKK